MPRQRQNTDNELQIIKISHDTSIRIGRPSCISRIKDATFSLIVNKFNWQIYTTTTFLLLRLFSSLYPINALNNYEWLNDTLFFCISNSYTFRRIHWNNNESLIFNSESKYYLPLFLQVFIVIFTIISYKCPNFYLTKQSIENFDISNIILLSFIISYIIITQIFTLKYLYSQRSHNKLLIKHICKYCLIGSYLYLLQVLNYMNVPYNGINNTVSEYHYHHWFIGLILLFITDLPQPYHSILQYSHYGIYLHGVSIYGYDTFVQ